MKKKLIAAAAVTAVIAAAAVIYVKTDISIPFIDNYAQNFTDNINAISEKLKYKAAELKFNREERKKDAAEDTPSDAVTDETVTGGAPADDTEAADTVDISSAEQQTGETGAPEEAQPVKSLELACEPIALSNASTARYAAYKGYILCVTENSITAYDKNGNVKWSTDIQISSPVLRASGNYILVFEQGGKKAEVYTEKKKCYSIDSEDNILTGDISSSGDAVFVTEKTYFKGSVAVYNKNGEEIFRWNSGKDSVIDADISASRRLAVALLNTGGTITSKVSFFDVTKPESDKNAEFDGSLIFDVEFNGDSLTAYADDKLISLSGNGKTSWVCNYEEKTLSGYSSEESGINLLSFDNNNNAELAVVLPNGKVQNIISSEILPVCTDISSGYALYGGRRELFLTRLSGTLTARFTASRDIAKAYIIDSEHIMVVYGSSIEFLKAVKAE